LQGAVYTEERKDYKVYHTEKIDKLKEIVEASNGQPVLAAIQFRFEYELIKKVFKYEVPIIYGKTPNTVANRLFQKWNNGSLPLLIVHPKSVSEGVNLQAGGHIIVWVALPWSLRDFIQLNGRLYRQGQANTVTINSITFKDTRDDVVWNVLKRRNATQQDLLDALAEHTRCLPRAATTPSHSSGRQGANAGLLTR
jgi:SNF2 family DNA or RNA helicase